MNIPRGTTPKNSSINMNKIKEKWVAKPVRKNITSRIANRRRTAMPILIKFTRRFLESKNPPVKI